MPINTDQCRIKCVALTPMPINKYQCRSMKINTDQLFSIRINVNQCWSIDHYWKVLIDIDIHWSALIIIEPHFGSITEFWPGIDQYWSALIIDTACPDIVALWIIICHEFGITCDVNNSKWLTSLYCNNQWEQMKQVSISFLPSSMEDMMVTILVKNSKVWVFTIIYSMNIKEIFGFSARSKQLPMGIEIF